MKQLMESSQAVSPARFRMHRVPSDVLKLITQLLDVKELGRCACTSSVLAAAAVSGFEVRARERGPGLILHAKGTSSEPDWRKLCRKAMSLQQPPAPRRLETVNPVSALKEANQGYMFTLEAFDGDPYNPATTCLSAVQARLVWVKNQQQGTEFVSVNAYFPSLVERDRIAFLRVLVSRHKTGDTALLYSGAATGRETSAGTARWFECYKPPWIELDDGGDDDGVVTGNGMVALVWKQAPDDKESDPACGAYFKKCLNQDSNGPDDDQAEFMRLSEVLFRLEHLLVFD